MRIAISMSLLLAATAAFGEGAGQPNDEQFLRMMQQRAEENQMDEDFKSPKKLDLDKTRAIRGSLSAPIKIVEYSDFQCPYCSKGFETVEEIRKKYGKKIVFMFKHMPLEFHPMALPAAKRFEAIAMQNKDKAYQFHDQIFKNQAKLSEGEKWLDSLAEGLKINMKKYAADINSQKVTDRIEKDKAEAATFGIRGTPGFYVTGVIIKGAYPAEVFYKFIDRRLGEKKAR